MAYKVTFSNGMTAYFKELEAAYKFAKDNYIKVDKVVKLPINLN